MGLGGIEYPLGGVCVLFGVALMVFLEHLAHIIMHGPHSHASAADSAAAAFPMLPSSGTDVEVGATACGAAKRASAQTSSNCEAADPSCGVLGDSSSVPMKPAMAVVVAEGKAAGEPGHSHVCVSRGSAGNWFSSTFPTNTQAASGSLRLKILAYMFGEQTEREGSNAPRPGGALTCWAQACKGALECGVQTLLRCWPYFALLVLQLHACSTFTCPLSPPPTPPHRAGLRVSQHHHRHQPGRQHHRPGGGAGAAHCAQLPPIPGGEAVVGRGCLHHVDNNGAQGGRISRDSRCSGDRRLLGRCVATWR